MKIFACISYKDSILVFRQPKYPEAGIQLPKGTVEKGESLEAALFREVREETLFVRRKFARWSFLGKDTFDMTPFGKKEIQQRFFYLLECKYKPKDTWGNYELLASGEKVLYEFFWIPKTQVKDLPFQQGRFL